MVELLRPVQGEYKFEDGLYQGALIAGIPNGEGRTTMDNGDVYDGHYLHGKKHGVGTYRWSNGDVYEGEHFEGQEHGRGIYRYASGDIYAGGYREGKRHGYGHLKLSSGTIEYAHFKQGNYEGRCIMISPDSESVSIGELKDNKQSGAWHLYTFKEKQAFVDGQLVAA